MDGCTEGPVASPTGQNVRIATETLTSSAPATDDALRMKAGADHEPYDFSETCLSATAGTRAWGPRHAPLERLDADGRQSRAEAPSAGALDRAGALLLEASRGTLAQHHAHGAHLRVAVRVAPPTPSPGSQRPRGA